MSNQRLVLYSEEDYLMLSGIQHFIFCRRQWALIHVEKQWAENFRTADGRVMHNRVHDSELRTRRGSVLTVRAMKIHSPTLGISGECDAVEFHEDSNGISLANTEGYWMPYPVEYKRGSKKYDHCDEAQLCAQAMCLEEMLCCDVPKGALYYGEERHRTEVEFSDELREEVKLAVIEMHKYYERGYTPKSKPSKSCNACSMKDLCLPKLAKVQSVEEYIKSNLGD